MKYRSLGAFAISMALSTASTNAHAQNEDEKESAVESDQQQKNTLRSPAKPEADGDAEPEPDQKSEAVGPASRPVTYGARSDWFIEPYGYVRFDAIEDSTQSFEDGIQPNLIARVGTYKGDHRRTLFSARDSRFGYFIGAPTVGNIKSYGQIELDFFGIAPMEVRRHDSVVFGPMRIRHAFVKVETPVVDLVAGQYYDVFGWGPYFYPSTVGYMGVPAQVYHRNPLLRLQKTIELGDLEAVLAVAAVRPGQRDSGVPEGQAGLKIAYKGWRGPAMSGFGIPELSAISIGLSGLVREFEAPVFRPEPASESLKARGYGLVANVLLPLIPAEDINDRGNSLTLTGEFSIGTGIADMYTFMDGGSRFPSLPNPSLAAPAPQYQANVDPGLVTIDRALKLKTINWQAFVVGAQYYLPINDGKVWLSGIYSRVWSDNIKSLTPMPSWGAIFTKMEYFDANLGFFLTPAMAVGLSLQSVKQTFGDVSNPRPVYGEVADEMLGIPVVDGTGGVPASARNNRAQLSIAFFF
jgi:hypothetical protein